MTADLGPQTRAEIKRHGTCQVLGKLMTLEEESIPGTMRAEGINPPTSIIMRPANAPLQIASARTKGLHLAPSCSRKELISSFYGILYW